VLVRLRGEFWHPRAII